MSVALKIANIKRQLASKTISPKLKEALGKTLEKLEKEASKSNKKDDAFSRAKKRRRQQGLSTAKSNIEKDAARPAKPKGKRFNKDGEAYYEYRDNRVDIKQPPKKKPKLEEGGIVVNNVGTLDANPRVELFKKGGKIGKLCEASEVMEVKLKNGKVISGKDVIYGFYHK